MAAPSADVAEITVIGTGGYGESIVIHLGNGSWAIVDSSIDLDTKQPVALQYLQSINVDPSAVTIIVCTHWHDDHIRGLADILLKCPKAIFCCSSAHDTQKFMMWISLEYQKMSVEPMNASTTTFNECIKILDKRSQPIRRAIADRPLFKIALGEEESVIYSLSPSDYTLDLFDKELAGLTKLAQESNIKIPPGTPNSKSVVLYLRLGCHRAILGADLEVAQDNKEGWLAITGTSTVTDKKATYFKIPHHGSENGYHSDIWQLLLEDNPLSSLTTYNRGYGLPEIEMLQKYGEHSDRLFSTSPTLGGKKKKRDTKTDKLIANFNKTIQEIKYQKGTIRARINLFDQTAQWEVELFENAFHINSLLA